MSFLRRDPDSRVVPPARLARTSHLMGGSRRGPCPASHDRGPDRRPPAIRTRTAQHAIIAAGVAAVRAALDAAVGVVGTGLRPPMGLSPADRFDSYFAAQSVRNTHATRYQRNSTPISGAKSGAFFVP